MHDVGMQHPHPVVTLLWRVGVQQERVVIRHHGLRVAHFGRFDVGHGMVQLESRIPTRLWADSVILYIRHYIIYLINGANLDVF